MWVVGIITDTGRLVPHWETTDKVDALRVATSLLRAARVYRVHVYLNPDTL